MVGEESMHEDPGYIDFSTVSLESPHHLVNRGSESCAFTPEGMPACCVSVLTGPSLQHHGLLMCWILWLMN